MEFPSNCVFPSEESKFGSLWKELQNRIKLCKVEAVSSVLPFDRSSALFKRPSLTEQELCQFSGALCYVKQAKRCSVCLCFPVLENWPWAIIATIVLCVCKGVTLLYVCLSICGCLLMTVFVSHSHMWYVLNSTESPPYLYAHKTQDLVSSLNQMQTSTHANPFANHFPDNRNSD